MGFSKVYFLIDVSGHMVPKITELSQVLREIVSLSPESTQFDINIFHNVVKKLAASQSKSSLNLNSVIQQINGGISYLPSTAVYDAFGQILNEIPYDPIQDLYHLIFVTNGYDNASVIYNLESVVNLCNEKLRRNVKLHFSLVHCGPKSALYNSLMRNLSVPTRFKLIDVQDSPSGIRIGLDQVKRERQNPPFVQPVHRPYISVQPVTVTNPVGAQDNEQLISYSEPPPSYESLFPQNRTTSNPSPFSRPDPPSYFDSFNEKSFQTKPDKELDIPCRSQSSKYDYVSLGFGAVASTFNNANKLQRKMQNSAGQPSNAFKIWIGNIPMVQQSLLTDYLQQWGPCRIETINGSPTQWAVVAYYDAKHMQNAVKYGNGSTFQGQVLNINKI